MDITYALANHLKKKDIGFCWIPGHAGITGNELADTAARSATGSSERFPIPHSDLKACFRLKLQSRRRFNGLGRHHVGWSYTCPFVTGVKLRDEVLEPYVHLFSGGCGPEFILIDDNARQHRALLVDEFLESEDVG
ncbi:DDE_3 domain-containing protein [Trichonephila clavipes]|nr:DDE_3 domain-containing protein [Trichonephila clavipes]